MEGRGTGQTRQTQDKDGCCGTEVMGAAWRGQAWDGGTSAGHRGWVQD